MSALLADLKQQFDEAEIRPTLSDDQLHSNASRVQVGVTDIQLLSILVIKIVTNAFMYKTKAGYEGDFHIYCHTVESGDRASRCSYTV